MIFVMYNGGKNMRLNRKTIGILLIVLLGYVISIEGSSGICSLSAGEEVQITTDESDQRDPAICEYIVVWTDYRNGNRDIYGIDPYTGEEVQITTDESNQWSPAIYGDIIVWTDNRNGNIDIYGYDLFTGEEVQITTDENNQRDPAIYKDIIVWTDNRNGGLDIYGDIFYTRSTWALERGDTLEATPPPVTTLPFSSTSPRLSFHGLFHAVLVVGLITMIVVGKMSIAKGRLAGKIKEKPEKFQMEKERNYNLLRNLRRH